MKGLSDILAYLPKSVSEAVGKISPFAASGLQELRLRVNRPLGLVINGRESYVTSRGGMTNSQSMALKITTDEIKGCFKAVCDYSVHSFSRELSEGFITLRGGHRVGLCATAVYNNGAFCGIHNISSMNFRIASERIGCASELFVSLFTDELKSVLIAGPPLCAKTTILRDLCRLLGGRYRISVIDPRGEIAAVSEGVPQNDIGIMTDVLDGYPKSEGIRIAVRVMSPQAVVCDEIGGVDEAEMMLDGLNSGVRFIATAHARDYAELCSRTGIRTLLSKGVFDYAVFLDSGDNIGKILEIRRAGEIYDEACGSSTSDRGVDFNGDIPFKGFEGKSLTAV